MLKRRLSAFQIVSSVYGTRGQGPQLLNYLYKTPKTQFEASDSSGCYHIELKTTRITHTTTTMNLKQKDLKKKRLLN